MRQVAKTGLLTVVATGGVFAAGGGVAFADAGATGTALDSSGMLSGNSVQAPVHVPVNLCGNTVNIVGLLDPALGNTCASPSHSGSGATGTTANSGGFASGNQVQCRWTYRSTSAATV